MAKAENGINRRWNGWRIAGWSFAAMLLVTPAVAMQISDEWVWGPLDFLFATAMIGGTGLLLEWAVRASGHWAYRAGAAVALTASFLLIWMNLAVGIIGDEGNPANLTFFGVIAVALAGAVAGRFTPSGMARAMLAAAIAEVAIGVAVLATDMGATEPPGPIGIQILNGFFAGLWLVSAWLFRQSRHDQQSIQLEA